MTVGHADARLRLDQFVVHAWPDLSRARAQALIADGRVLVNGLPAKPARKVAEGESVSVTVPPPVEVGLAPEAIPLDVVYEDADLLVINKPAGMVVHPAPGHQRSTLVNAVLARCPDLAGIGGGVRPGIVHRLDKDTSGLLVVAKHDAAHQALAGQLKQRRFTKRYLALVQGALEFNAGVVDAPIGRHPRHRNRMAVRPDGREAETSVRDVERFPGYTLVEATPITGRTHQIRVHLSYIGHPIAGDPVYGAGPARSGIPGLRRQFLHAARLGFILPRTGAYREFAAPLPPDLQAALHHLRATGHVAAGGQ